MRFWAFITWLLTLVNWATFLIISRFSLDVIAFRTLFLNRSALQARTATKCFGFDDFLTRFADRSFDFWAEFRNTLPFNWTAALFTIYF